MAPLSKQKQRVKTEIKQIQKLLQEKPPPPPETCKQLEISIAKKYKKLELWKVSFIIYSPVPNYGGGGAFIFLPFFSPKYFLLSTPILRNPTKSPTPPPFLLSCPHFNILSI